MGIYESAAAPKMMKEHMMGLQGPYKVGKGVFISILC